MTATDRLRDLMRLAPGTATAKAAAAGVSRVYWQEVIRTENPKEPSLSVAAKIVASLGGRLGDLDPAA